MGPSVNQDGDPVPRQVIHISRRRPVVYLLMQPPGYGKTSIASRLFAPGNVPVISADEIIQRIAKRELGAPAELMALVEKDYSPFSIDQTTQRIFDNNVGAGLVDMWIAQSGHADFAVDGFVPAEYRAQVENQFIESGYLPVTFEWERVAPSSAPSTSINDQIVAFNTSLSVVGTQDRGRVPKTSRQPSAGYVDEVKIGGGFVIVRGWAIDEDGSVPEQLVVGIGAERTFVDIGETHERTDVQRHLKFPHPQLGYLIRLPVPAETDLESLGKQGFLVTLASGRPLRISQRVIDSMVAGAGVERRS